VEFVSVGGPARRLFDLPPDIAVLAAQYKK
jgi:hypothetical protein